jgi:hypothetical protein
LLNARYGDSLIEKEMEKGTVFNWNGDLNDQQELYNEKIFSSVGDAHSLDGAR